MSKRSGITLAVLLMLAGATPALAAKPLGLTAGGRTLAGPGSIPIAVNATVTVYTDATGSADACATVANAGSSPVRLTLVGDASPTIDVAVSGSGALCEDGLERVDLTCLGPGACSAQWRVDNN
jgi:hypothetical protein